MTPDEAKAILNLCPPDDETNPEVPGVGEALGLAENDSKLGAWWAQEKNFDRQFSRKLAALAPPGELAATIMRGGATIFFASRLIAESTGEPLAELPAIADEPNPKKSAVAALAADLRLDDEPTRGSSPTWWWRAAVLSVALLVIFLLALLSVLPVSSKSGGLAEAQLPAFTHYAAQLAALAPPPPAGQTLADMQQYLAANHAPNPPDPLGLASSPNGATPRSVSAEVWTTHSITHYIVQTGAVITHLFILNQAEFPAHESRQKCMIAPWMVFASRPGAPADLSM